MCGGSSGFRRGQYIIFGVSYPEHYSGFGQVGVRTSALVSVTPYEPLGSGHRGQNISLGVSYPIPASRFRPSGSEHQIWCQLPCL